ncbi:syntaxin-11-like [Eucyclogobius newberryi]|uniref:syntaxin-11-like n=1 Tax=Eucyclogobius newberryi TaxID=166745 RepID=UPI003B5A8C90
MRDLMERLYTVQEENEANFFEPEVEDDPDTVRFSQEAVVFETHPVLEKTLKEAHAIRKEIKVLHFEVERLGAHNERFGTSVRRLTLLKKDSDTIARDIVQRGQFLHTRIHALGIHSRQLKKTEGSHRAVSRIAKTQHDTLTYAFYTVISDYNKAEMMQRSMCRGRIKRHASIMGTEITDQQLDELVDKGGEGWAEFSQSLQTQGARSSRWALREIQGRHKELLELESRLKQVHELFLQIAILVEEQGSMLNNIEANVNGTQEYVDRIQVQIKKALKYKKKNPCLQFCPCLPCWRQNKTF